jgi:hypothetical protein
LGGRTARSLEPPAAISAGRWTELGVSALRVRIAFRAPAARRFPFGKKTLAWVGTP